jgi:hypothetical protein
MARTGSGTATTTPATITITGAVTSIIEVFNTGANPLRLCVPRVHGNDFVTIAASSSGMYRTDQASVDAFIVMTDADTTTYQWEVVAGKWRD